MSAGTYCRQSGATTPEGIPLCTAHGEPMQIARDLGWRCRVKAAARNTAYRERHPERTREASHRILARKHGVSYQEYEASIAAGCQLEGVGACGGVLGLDHDHSCCPGRWSCGQCVRGALCFSHNRWLEKVARDPSQLLRVAEYLA